LYRIRTVTHQKPITFHLAVDVQNISSKFNFSAILIFEEKTFAINWIIIRPYIGGCKKTDFYQKKSCSALFHTMLLISIQEHKYFFFQLRDFYLSAFGLVIF
jgi:hypothetical protein